VERIFYRRVIVAIEFGCVTGRQMLRDHLGLLFLPNLLFV
jgi:hypothetical protein